MIKLLLRVLISVLVLFLLVGFVYALDPTRVYELNLLYEGGLVSVESMTVGFAYPPAEGFELINPYELKLLNVYGDLDYDYKNEELGIRLTKSAQKSFTLIGKYLFALWD